MISAGTSEETPSALTITFEGDYIVRANGVRISITLLAQFLNEPPRGLLSFTREGDHMRCQQVNSVEEAVEFFKP